MTRSSVIILQPYVPSYRAPFFEGLHDALQQEGLDLTVIAGLPRGEQADRKDSAGSTPWLRTVPSRDIRVGRHQLSYRYLRRNQVAGAAVVVAELAITSIDAWVMGLRRTVAPWRLLYWGHVKNFVTPNTQVTAMAKRMLLTRADGVLAYTAEGGYYARQLGVPQANITVVNNAAQVPRIPPGNHSIAAEPVFAFIGGLDESKRLEALVLTADAIHSRLPAFRLIVAGKGRQEGFLEQAARARPYISLIGRADDQAKMTLAKSAIGILMPGRVGLVAIDSFALGLPIVTTEWSEHAPEFHYLKHGRNALIARNDVAALADAAVLLYEDEALRAHLRAGCMAAAEVFSLENMINSFRDGVLRAAAGLVDRTTAVRLEQEGEATNGLR